MENSVACDHVEENDERAAFLGFHLKEENLNKQFNKESWEAINLDEFVPCSWDLFSSSCLEAGHARWDVLPLVDDVDEDDDDDGDDDNHLHPCARNNVPQKNLRESGLVAKQSLWKPWSYGEDYDYHYEYKDDYDDH